MNLVALPAFSDNLIWMLHNGREALVVDPGDASPVVAALDDLQLSLTGILVTHHHADHVSGLKALQPHLSGPIWGPAESMPTPVQVVQAGARLDWADLTIQVLAVPGHTLGHLAFVVNATSPLLFCGDTLFSGGCGRLFEGSPAQMHASLQQFMALPEDTQVCCAHEYTLSNLRFACAVEPDNQDLLRHVEHCKALRAQGLWTLPSTLRQERLINPFLRCDQPAVQAAAQHQGAVQTDPVSVLAALRHWKNNFQ